MAILINKAGKISHGRTVLSPVYGYYEFSDIRIGAETIDINGFLSDGIVINQPYAVYYLASSEVKQKQNEETGETDLIGEVYINYYVSKAEYDNGTNEIPLVYTGGVGADVTITNRIKVTFPGPIPFDGVTGGDIAEKVCRYIHFHTKIGMADKYDFLSGEYTLHSEYNAKGTTIPSKINYYQNKICKQRGEKLTIDDWKAYEQNFVKIPTSGIPDSVSGVNIITQGLHYFTIISNPELADKIPEINGLIDVTDING